MAAPLSPDPDFRWFAGRSGGGGKILREARAYCRRKQWRPGAARANDGVNHRSEIVVVLQLAAAEAAGFRRRRPGPWAGSVSGSRVSFAQRRRRDAEIRGDEIEDQRAVPCADERGTRTTVDSVRRAEAESAPGRSNREEERRAMGFNRRSCCECRRAGVQKVERVRAGRVKFSRLNGSMFEFDRVAHLNGKCCRRGWRRAGCACLQRCCRSDDGAGSGRAGDAPVDAVTARGI